MFSELDESTLVSKLESYPVQFRSIAYEAAAMQFGLQDLKSKVHLLSWQQFCNNYAHMYSTPCCIGLGWAFAQQQLNPADFFRFTEGDFNLKVCDGYGYYEGFFRRRKSVVSREQPECFSALMCHSYDQGLGRSIWYSSKADVQLAAKTVNEFPDNRKPDLWTGLGIAIAYVGGCNQQMLEEILDIPGEYKSNLQAGAKMALATRELAGAVTEDVLLAVEVFGGQHI